jgi:hypothetical protein
VTTTTDMPAGCASFQCSGSVLQGELEPFVRRDESELRIEAVRVASLLITRELHQSASAGSGFIDRPLEHQTPQPTAAKITSHAHGLDLSAPRATPSQPWQEAELHRGDDPRAVNSNHQKMRRIGIDRGKRLLVSLRKVAADRFASGSEPIIGEEAHDGRHICGAGSAQHNGRLSQSQARKLGHP